MTCVNCNKNIADWDVSFLDELFSPKYYEEIQDNKNKIKNYLCSPSCSLEWYQRKIKNENNK
jgi:hypothetical protein